MFKKLIKSIIYRHKATSESYIKYLKSKGVRCGDNIQIFFPHETHIDVLNPHLLEMGSNIAMTGPVTILTHDYSVFVANHISHGRLFGKQKSVILGNNIFVGWGGTILPGSVISDNVIIGANSVVSGYVKPNSVYAGNPARFLCTIEEYINKRKDNQLSEAVDIFVRYYDRYGRYPTEDLFHEYFYIFTSGEMLSTTFKKKMIENGNYNECLAFLRDNTPLFKNYEQFCEYAISFISESR